MCLHTWGNATQAGAGVVRVSELLEGGLTCLQFLFSVLLLPFS